MPGPHHVHAALPSGSLSMCVLICNTHDFNHIHVTVWIVLDTIPSLQRWWGKILRETARSLCTRPQSVLCQQTNNHLSLPESTEIISIFTCSKVFQHFSKKKIMKILFGLKAAYGLMDIQILQVVKKTHLPFKGHAFLRRGRQQPPSVGLSAQERWPSRNTSMIRKARGGIGRIHEEKHCCERGT